MGSLQASHKPLYIASPIKSHHASLFAFSSLIIELSPSLFFFFKYIPLAWNADFPLNIQGSDQDP